MIRDVRNPLFVNPRRCRHRAASADSGSPSRDCAAPLSACQLSEDWGCSGRMRCHWVNAEYYEVLQGPISMQKRIGVRQIQRRRSGGSNRKRHRWVQGLISETKYASGKVPCRLMQKSNECTKPHIKRVELGDRKPAARPNFQPNAAAVQQGQRQLAVLG